jgi:PAS domain S-box-containing protein
MVRDPARLAALERTLLLDSPAEPAFDRLTHLAACLLHVPIALVSLVDDMRQFFKSAVGLPEPWASLRQTPLSHSFCQHEIVSGKPLIVVDARQDPRLCDHPAISDLHVVAYAGIPLLTADGHAIGSFCVIDSEPREWTADDMAVLRELAAAAITEIELRAATLEAQQRADEAERERREKTAILESITDAFIALDRDWRFTYVNAAAERAFQRPRSTLMGRCVWAEFPEVAGSSFEHEYRRAVADQVTVAFEALYPPLGIWVDARAYPTADGLAVYFHDITTRKQTEEALRESEARLQAVADLVPDLLWSTDPGGTTDWYNRRWLEYTGQSLAEARGYGWLDAIHPDDRESSLRNFQGAIAGGEPLRQEHRIRGADGQYRWFLVRAHLLRDEDGHSVRWYGSATDIHNERTALEQAQAAQAEAEGALKARDAFMSMVSHDLKQPLGVIQAYADLGLRRLRRTDTVPLERIADSLGKIQAAARRMTEFINELLDAAQLRAGQLFDLEVGPTDLVALVRRVVAEQQQTTEHHRLHVTAPAPELVGDYDAARLERVLANLLSNAIRYSPEGGTITISVLQEVDGAAAWSVIQVRDEGMGIPAADLPYIFERFRRGTNVMGQIGGSGIGLASAQQIVEQHGGTIGVKSVEGRGTTFTVRLPVVAHEAV